MRSHLIGLLTALLIITVGINVDALLRVDQQAAEVTVEDDIFNSSEHKEHILSSKEFIDLCRPGFPTANNRGLKSMGCDKGSLNNGIPYYQHLYKWADNEWVAITKFKYGSADAAVAEIIRRGKSASKVIERTPKLNNEGQQVGERLVNLYTLKTGNVFSFVCWTDGEWLYIIQSLSLDPVLEFEKRFSDPGPIKKDDSTALDAQKDQDAIDEVSETSDPNERARRDEKRRRYNKGGTDLTTMDPNQSVSVNVCGPAKPFLPTVYTPVIVLGTVVSAQPYLTEDRSSIYTEYSVRVEEFLKKDGLPLQKAGELLVVDRPGGKLRLKSGKVIRYSWSGSNIARPLKPGERCVLFLERIHDGFDIRLGPAFLLREGKAYYLWESEGHDKLVGTVSGIQSELSNEEPFLELVRKAIANPPLKEFYSR
jgi:hypothetical protein